MTIEQILTIEATNDKSIYLFKEGIFVRAYERSAMRFVRSMVAYKVFKKHYKQINCDVCYLGFPQKYKNVLFARYGVCEYEETAAYIRIDGNYKDADFEEWKAGIPFPTVEDVRPQFTLREDVKRREVKHIQLYKKGYDILLELHRLADTLPKVHKYVVGERIKNEAIDLALAAYRVGVELDVEQNRLIIKEKVEIIRLLLRMLKDLKCLSLKYFTAVNVALEDLYVNL